VAITEQLAVVMSHLRHSLVSVEVDLDPVTDEELGAIRFRMLSPDPELRRAMAFADDYILLGNKTQVTSGLGNAVTPPVATWITRQCLATLGGEVMRDESSRQCPGSSGGQSGAHITHQAAGSF